VYCPSLESFLSENHPSIILFYVVHRMMIMAELDPNLEELNQEGRIKRTIGKRWDSVKRMNIVKRMIETKF